MFRPMTYAPRGRISQPAAVASASLARSSPRCQPWISRPRLPSGSSRLWSGPATKPSSEIDMWQVVSGIGVPSEVVCDLVATANNATARRHATRTFAFRAKQQRPAYSRSLGHAQLVAEVTHRKGTVTLVPVYPTLMTRDEFWESDSPKTVLLVSKKVEIRSPGWGAPRWSKTSASSPALGSRRWSPAHCLRASSYE